MPLPLYVVEDYWVDGYATGPSPGSLYVVDDYWVDGYTNDASPPVPPLPPARSRGDDAGRRSSGARERFWQAKAAEWLDERLETITRARGKPLRTRKRVADRAIVAVPDYVAEFAELAPVASALDGLAERIAAKTPDYAALARYVAEQHAMIAAWKTKQRRRRDAEAMLVLMD